MRSVRLTQDLYHTSRVDGQLGAMQAVVTQRAKEQSHAWAASALPTVCGNDGCSLGAAPCGAMQLQQLPSCMRDRTLGPRGARTMYDSLARASMNVNNRHSQRSEVECQADTQTPTEFRLLP